MRRFAHRPSPAMVVACIALLVALGGTSIAAVSQIPRNSVGTPQLRNNAVTTPKIRNRAVTAAKIRDNAVVRRKIPNDAITSAKVQNGSLLAVDFAEGQIPQGPAGPAGPAGPQGPAGPGARWALVSKTGTILAQSGGITMASASGGNYYLNFGSAQTGKMIVATPVFRNDDNAGRGIALVTICGGTASPETATCSTANTTSHVWVGTLNSANTATEAHAFYVAVIG